MLVAFFITVPFLVGLALFIAHKQSIKKPRKSYADIRAEVIKELINNKQIKNK